MDVVAEEAVDAEVDVVVEEEADVEADVEEGKYCKDIFLIFA